MTMNNQQPVRHLQQEGQFTYYRDTNLQQQTLATISPAVRHGLREAQYLGYPHAITEAVAIGYLMGRGSDYDTAWRTVESWWRPPGTPLPQMY